VNGTNAEILAALHREVLHGNFRGRIVLDCERGTIARVEVVQRWTPPHQRTHGEPDAVLLTVEQQSPR
jgi:hypothetical protein